MTTPRKIQVNWNCFRLPLYTAGIAAALLTSFNTYAFQIDTGDSGVKASWENTIKYSTAFRVSDLDESVAATSTNPNVDDGDRNFDKGLISNRLDLLSEFNIRYQNIGARISAAAWYDDVYNNSNDNDSPATFNGLSVDNDEFTDDTKELHGRDIELLDAFVYGSTNIGSSHISARLGQFTEIYGESLFFGANGIASAQGPVDLIKLQSVPGSQFKEILRPVPQLSTSLHLSNGINLGAYYQFGWEKTRLPASGSYFSNGDFVGEGAETVNIGFPLIHASDLEAKDSGQFGVQMKFSYNDWDFGLYAAKYHAKTPQFYWQPAFAGGDDTYKAVYAEDIKTYGASFSTLVGEANVAGEVSVRIDTPLAAHGGVVFGAPLSADNGDNAAYPVGNSLHAQLSMIDLYGESSLWDAAALVGEVAYNRRLSVKKNKAMLDPNSTRDAVSLRFTFEPQYFQVIPGVDLQVPITVGYTPYGRSSVTPLAFAPEHGGDITIGVKADYQKTWYGSLSYTNFFGSGGPIVRSDNNYSFDQTMADRDFIALSIQRKF
ncbi:DUF1302 domain-containing protein [Marinobacterium lutimaris]|uniref:DUF1302 domain-containing protein n=1 Tax=Marinobacterium lutimaris TaxID=568106 RepID=A0A1H6DSR1_9GAMM|nr:DUF1302 domain-containing protein [Marinobacterium lutimaris]SEG88268.1 Protein of unknown function [Marinobacterium lutimaris]